MVNFQEDMEHEEDYEIGWEWIEEDTGPYIAPYTGFGSVFLIQPKTTLKISSKLCSHHICT